MKVKRVNRYYCEFCKKSGCSGGHIAKHERHCTRNPNRICRMCKMVGQEQQPKIMDLKLLLPTPVKFPDRDYEYFLVTELTREFLEATGGCPACTLAAILQSGYPMGAYDYDFKTEAKKVWDEIKDLRIREMP